MSTATVPPQAPVAVLTRVRLGYPVSHNEATVALEYLWAVLRQHQAIIQPVDTTALDVSTVVALVEHEEWRLRVLQEAR